MLENGTKASKTRTDEMNNPCPQSCRKVELVKDSTWASV